MGYTPASTASVASNLLQIKAIISNSYGGLSTPGSVSLPSINGPSFTYGTGAGKFSLVGFSGGSLAATAANIDLTTLTDGQGNSCSSLTKVRGLMVLNFSTADSLVLGDAVTNPWSALWGATGTHELRPGRTNPTTGQVEPGLFLETCGDATGYAVSGTSKVLKIDPGSATISYFLALFGE